MLRPLVLLHFVLGSFASRSSLIVALPLSGADPLLLAMQADEAERLACRRPQTAISNWMRW
jgi:hypothetical protein